MERPPPFFGTTPLRHDPPSLLSHIPQHPFFNTPSHWSSQDYRPRDSEYRCILQSPTEAVVGAQGAALSDAMLSQQAPLHSAPPTTDLGIQQVPETVGGHVPGASQANKRQLVSCH